jgi:RNA polymerase sigma factor (sigma-70 family)
MATLSCPVAAPPLDGSALVEAFLPEIDRAVAFVCRRQRLPREQASELASEVYLRLLQRDAAVLRQYRGDSSLRTFLVVVIQRVLLDLRIATAGKWRPSARARRLGRVAMHLERLVFHDGLTLSEAAPLVRARLGVTDTDDELHFLLALLPVRFRRRMVGDGELDHLRAATPDAEETLVRASAAPGPRALAKALRALSGEDRRMLSLRFARGLRLCEIARLQRADEKAFYRRFHRALATVRASVDVKTDAAASLKPLQRRR